MPFKLTDALSRAARPREKRYKLEDGEGISIGDAPPEARCKASTTIRGARRHGFPLGPSCREPKRGPGPARRN